MKRYSKILCLLLVLTMPWMSGCGKKDTDPGANEVMKLQLTPEPTPTPEPQAADPKAVTSKGSVTMINEYLDQKIKEEARAAAEADQAAETVPEETNENEEN